MTLIDPEKVLIVAIPSHDGRSISGTIVALFSTAIALDRSIYWMFPQGTGISNVRTAAVRELDAAVEPRTDDPKFGDFYIDYAPGFHYVLWIDSDIKLNCDPHDLARFITTAEEKSCGFAGNCHIAVNRDGEWKSNLFRPKALPDDPPGPYTAAELEAAAPFTLPVASTGLALCYVKVPKGYVFHEDGKLGEDGYFFKECQQPVFYVPLGNFHQKLMML